jgi:hypothetical protein
MLTAAVRDLHRALPGRYLTAVDTSCPALWENNPYVVPRDALGASHRVVECGYPLVHCSNQRPFHFIHGFTQDLEQQLGETIPVGPFKGDLYLSDDEVQRPPPAVDVTGPGPYWVLVAGGKFDLTAKWWDPSAAQAVVDYFAGRVRFVQCGAPGDWHPSLRGVVNLVGRTTLRELVRVVYHAEGVLCPVTFAMHLAAAVPPRSGGPPLKPCVVVAGGREPAHWEMYPGHQFLHTVGALPCCAAGGCWKSRCQPVGDGDASDADLCTSPVTVANGLQVGRCMTMIPGKRVIDAVETYYVGGTLDYARPRSSLPSEQTKLPTEEQGKPVAGGVAREPSGGSPTARPQGVAVTIGVGTYANMARLAACEVAALTGLECVVIGDDVYERSGLGHPDFLKFRLFDLTDADNIFFFDADMVCLERWNPAQFFGRAELTCVRDRLVQPIREEADDWGVAAEEYFNAGMFIVSRSHHADMLREAERIHRSRGTAFFAQSPLNAARSRLGVPLNMLDRRYNWVGFGSSTLSHEVPVVMAHKLVPDSHAFNLAYFAQAYELHHPSIAINAATTRRVAGKTFVMVEENSRRRLTLRGDGTIVPGAGPAEEGYWFVHDLDGRPRLALASEERVEREFLEVFGGSWMEAEALRRGEPGARVVDAGMSANATPTEANARDVAEAFLQRAPAYPAGRFSGRGVVICGGGERYFPSAWVCIRMLRHLGCRLPVELWHVTDAELDEPLRRLVSPYGVRCVNAEEVRLCQPVRMLNGWEIKPYAIAHCRFEEVLLLDADNVPVRDPTYLFESDEYAAAGSVFWPDYGRLGPDHPIWRICRVPFNDEPEFETGQVVVDKSRCWLPLQLTGHLNDHSDFYYRYIYGDKDTFHLAWRILGMAYAMMPSPLEPLQGVTMCQHDFQGRRLFQHRHGAKWTLNGENPRIAGFEMEDVCLEFLQELSARWRPSKRAPRAPVLSPAFAHS